MARQNLTDCQGVHRRNFLKLGAAGLLGLSLPEALRREAHAEAQGRAGKAKSVIMVWLAGGPATIDMWDLKPEAPEGIRGEFKPIKTSAPGVEISEHLPHMAKVMDKAAILRSIAHGIGSHSLGTTYMTTGNRPSVALKYPLLGSLCAKMMTVPPGVPPHVSMTRIRNTDAGYLGTAYNPFEVTGNASRGQLQVKGISLPNGFSLEDLEKRNKILQQFDNHFKTVDGAANLAEGLDEFQQKALDILRSDKTKKAFDLNSEDSKVRDRYGKDNFGQGALAARRLVEAGVRYVTIGTGGWDSHNKNFDRLKTKLLPPIDKVVSTLISDLDERGMLDSTIVYLAGEFGRTPKVNKKAGRDHWGRSMAVLVAGGGFKGGLAYGTTDDKGMAPAIDPCTPDDLCATMFHNLGFSPEHELQTQTGRPLSIFREGKIIPALLG